MRSERDALRQRASGTRIGRDRLSLRALFYLVAVATIAAAVAGPFLPRLEHQTDGWITFLILALAAGVAQLFLVRTGKNTSYHTTIVFLIPAALLLHGQVALIPIIQHLPDWLKNRAAWYIQSFNICNYTISILAASGGALVLQSGLLEGYPNLSSHSPGSPRACSSSGSTTRCSHRCSRSPRSRDPRVGPFFDPEPLD